MIGPPTAKPGCLESLARKLSEIVSGYVVPLMVVLTVGRVEAHDVLRRK